MVKFKIAAMALLLSGCNPFAAAEGAEEELDEFRQRAAAQEFEAIWRDADGDFKQATSREELVQVMESQRGSVGPVVSSERKGLNINSNNGVTVVTMQMETVFESASGEEEFQFVQRGGDWKLVTYRYETDMPQKVVSD